MVKICWNEILFTTFAKIIIFNSDFQISWIMWSKEEAKELRVKFWSGFKRYCYKHRIDRRWVLTGVKIKSVCGMHVL